MDIEKIVNEAERPEPFTSVMEMVGKHGNWEVLDCLANIAGLDSENPEFSPEFREEAAYLHQELSHLLERYFWEFVTSDPDTEEPEQPTMRFYPTPGVEV